MAMRPLICALFGALALLVVAPATVRADGKPLVVLVSIDGFKRDYLHRGNSPALDAMADAGTLAKGMRSSFPSLTFPNHYTIVTGLFPDHHGIVNNTMFDPAMPGVQFSPGARDPQWWDEGIPIWVTMRRQGKRSATLFWPGSDAPIHGVQPDDWLPYNEAMTSAERAAKLLSWLARPDEERADFTTLYFSEVDTAGHQHGPDALQVGEAVKRVDTAIENFLAGLDQLGLRSSTDIVVVSDHGMAGVDPSHAINLKALLDGLETARIQWTGALAGFTIDPKEQDTALSRLAPENHVTCWPKTTMPDRIHFGTHRRVPDVVCLADVGWTIIDNPDKPLASGQHGYDPADPAMWGLFLATGPHIRQRKLGLIDNVDVYLLLCNLIGVWPEQRHDASVGLVKLVIK
jgi:predicted AlkP superfamily pyrophosphatase or phosphodiesterase